MSSRSDEVEKVLTITPVPAAATTWNASDCGIEESAFSMDIIPKPVATRAHPIRFAGMYRFVFATSTLPSTPHGEMRSEVGRPYSDERRGDNA